MPGPVVYSIILLTCPQCHGETVYEGEPDEEEGAENPGLPNPCHCLLCVEGLQAAAVPVPVLHHAFREGNTPEQAYAELVAGLNEQPLVGHPLLVAVSDRMLGEAAMMRRRFDAALSVSKRSPSGNAG